MKLAVGKGVWKTVIYLAMFGVLVLYRLTDLPFERD